jgi:hypothetical protein
LEIAVFYQMSLLNQPVGKGRFAVVYMRDDAKVAYVRGFIHVIEYTLNKILRQ